MAQILADGRQTWWDYGSAEWLDTLLRRNTTDCAAILSGLERYLMDIYKECKDYKKDQAMMEPFLPIQLVDDEDEREEGDTEYRVHC